MEDESDDTGRTSQIDLEAYRAYLTVVAESVVFERWRQKFDPADIVQDTLVHALGHTSTLAKLSDAQRVVWLRRALAGKLANLRRRFNTEARAIDREVSLERAVETSSGRYEAWLAAQTSTPSSAARRRERSLVISRALLELTHEQRSAIVLTYFLNHTLEEAGEVLERNGNAIAGLVHRGVKRLAAKLKTLEGEI